MDTQLLATLIGGKNAQAKAANLVSELPTLQSLKEASVPYLTKKVGVGAAQRIKAAVSLKPNTTSNDVINCAEEAHKALAPLMEGKEQEEFWVMGLNNRKRILFLEMVFKGKGNELLLSSDIWRRVIREGAACAIFAHNHPSGDSSPSNEDIKATKRFAKQAKLLGIGLLDHIIIGNGNYRSLNQYIV